MQNLIFKPFTKAALIEGLHKQFPQYKIQTGFGTLQVRTKGFTLTGNVQVKSDPGKGKITTQTNLDMAFVLLIFCFPVGIYVLTKKEKIKQIEAEVVAGLKRILEPAG